MFRGGGRTRQLAWGWVVFSMLRDKNPARWEYEPWSPPPFSAVIVGTRGVGVGPEACVLTCACLALPKLTAFSAPVLPLNVRNTQVHGDGGVGGGAIASIHSQALCPSLSSQVLTVRITHSTVTCTTQNRPNVECSVLPVPSTRRGCTYRPASGSEGGGCGERAACGAGLYSASRGRDWVCRCGKGCNASRVQRWPDSESAPCSCR